jgi:tetratricopeptide (TPR) repeat protein
MQKFLNHIILFLFSGILLAQSPGQNRDFEKANAEYEKGNYQEAIALYESALNGSKKSAEAFNNLGLAYYKSGDLGKAVLNFERALRQNANYKNAQNNLRAARQQVDTNIKAKSFWLFSAWNFISNALSSIYWTILFWIFLYGALFLLIFWFLTRSVKMKRIILRATMGSFALSLLLFLFARTSYQNLYDGRQAIVISTKVGLRSSPDLNGEDLIILSSGVKLKIIEEKTDWSKVRLENRAVGWIPRKLIERI